MSKYGFSNKELSEFVLGCSLEDVCSNVVIAPCWEPNSIELNVMERISQKGNVWNGEIEGIEFTYILSGVGAGINADIVSALGETKCNKLLFIGSAGAIRSDINVGDIVIPTCLVCGDGACRYLQKDIQKDVFGEKIFIKTTSNRKIALEAELLAKKNNIRCWSNMTTTSVESLFSQFDFLEIFREYDCGCVDMESTAVIKAAEKNGIDANVCFVISDNAIQGKSLITVGENDTLFRKNIRKKVMLEIIRVAFM